MLTDISSPNHSINSRLSLYIRDLKFGHSGSIHSIPVRYFMVMSLSLAWVKSIFILIKGIFL